MKQLLFLLLFPCLAMAQYTGNAGQKITLGEQTTADGLVYRGVANDTNVITPFSDTSAYIILDTVNSKFYHYNRTTTYWALAGGGVSVTSFSAGTTGLTPSTATTGVVTLGGTLAVANGGTGATSLSPNNYLIRTNSSGIFDTSAVYEIGGNVGIGTSTPSAILHINKNTSVPTFERIIQGRSAANNTFILGVSDPDAYFAAAGAGGLRFAVNSNLGVTGTSVPNNVAMTILSTGNVGVGTLTPGVQFHTTGTIRYETFAGGGISTLTIDNAGDLTRTSSIQLKKDVTPINYGLNEILQINPINFNWIDEDKFGNENENGFIAEDVMSVIPNVVASDTHGLFMDYTKLIPILTKAIQEQQALINSLEQRILILENK